MDGNVSFSVNGSYQAPPTNTPEEKRRAAKIRNVVSEKVTEFISQQPDGVIFSTGAIGGDGKGGQRTRAYMRQGFSDPYNGRNGGPQYGIVKDGRLRPITENQLANARLRLREEATAAVTEQSVNAMRNMPESAFRGIMEAYEANPEGYLRGQPEAVINVIRERAAQIRANEANASSASSEAATGFDRVRENPRSMTAEDINGLSEQDMFRLDADELLSDELRDDAAAAFRTRQEDMGLDLERPVDIVRRTPEDVDDNSINILGRNEIRQLREHLDGMDSGEREQFLGRMRVEARDALQRRLDEPAPTPQRSQPSSNTPPESPPPAQEAPAPRTQQRRPAATSADELRDNPRRVRAMDIRNLSDEEFQRFYGDLNLGDFSRMPDAAQRAATERNRELTARGNNEQGADDANQRAPRSPSGDSLDEISRTDDEEADSARELNDEEAEAEARRDLTTAPSIRPLSAMLDAPGTVTAQEIRDLDDIELAEIIELSPSGLESLARQLQPDLRSVMAARISDYRSRNQQNASSSSSPGSQQASSGTNSSDSNSLERATTRRVSDRYGQPAMPRPTSGPTARKYPQPLAEADIPGRVRIPPRTTRTGRQVNGRTARKTFGSTRVSLNVSQFGSVTFTVNGSYTVSSRNPTGEEKKEAKKAAKWLRKRFKEIVAELPDGVILQVSAAGGDGKAGQRTRAYMRQGFSDPYNGRNGGTQVGIVKGGRLYPLSNSDARIANTRRTF